MAQWNFECRMMDLGSRPATRLRTQGIGLANTRARLQQLYGQDARLEIENCDVGG